MDKFKNKYRTSSHRKPNWDYSADALYFLTIVTQNRECNLGFIEPETHEMELSDFGKIVEREWYESFDIRNELILHEFILMPNHLHAIVEIYDENRNDVDDDGGDDDDGRGTVETHGRVSLPVDPIESVEPITPIESEISPIKRNPPIRLPKSISSFIAGFKSAVNSQIDDYIDEHQLPIPKYNRNNHFFQPNYHDHIIRNHIEYQNIRNYIQQNRSNWYNDKLR